MFMQKPLFVTLGLLAASTAFANQSEPMYQYLPAEVVKQNIETTLSQHQIDASNLDIQIDSQGIVNASGNVGSKQEAENITKIIQDSQAVYGVFGKFIYPEP
jgi:hypothetical protein